MTLLVEREREKREKEREKRKKEKRKKRDKKERRSLLLSKIGEDFVPC